MVTILILILGLVLGGIFGYLILKLMLQKSYVRKVDFNEAEKKISALQLENATRFSKDEVETKFVSMQLYDSINANLSKANEILEEERELSKEYQKSIL